MTRGNQGNTIRRHWLAWSAAACMGLAGCGGGGGGNTEEEVTPPAPVPETPVPAFTYAPDAGVCAWVDAYIAPFAWPAQSVGPRTWAPAQVRTVATPERNGEGLAKYRLTSNLFVLQSFYGPQIQARNLSYSSPQVWAQQAACKHGITPLGDPGALGYTLEAYMPDATAQRLADEEYTAGIEQVDACVRGPVFSSEPQPSSPLPDFCNKP